MNFNVHYKGNKMKAKGIAWVAGMVTIALQVSGNTLWNGSVSDNWSDAGNWTAGVPSSSGEWTADIRGHDNGGLIVLDAATDVGWFLMNTPAKTDFVIQGPNALTVNVNSSINSGRNAIENKSAYDLTLDADAVVQGVADYRIIRSSGGGLISFNGDLTVSDSHVLFYGNNTVNRRLVADSDVRVGAGTLTFNNTIDNSFDTLTIAETGAELVVNTADGVNFYDGESIALNRNGELVFNGADVIGDSTRLTLGSAVTDATVSFNANETLGVLSVVGSGLMLNLGADVDNLAFADSSHLTWNSGVIFTNFRAGVISFGTDENGLSASQLAASTAYYADGTLVTDLSLDAAGYMIPEPATISFIALFGISGLVVRRIFLV